MAVLKSEIVQNMAQSDTNRSTYEAIVTSVNDLSGSVCTDVYGVGSLVLCLEDNKVRIKLQDGTWEEV
ncbi:MAG: hypothetical protein II062_04030 [Oscillospiraceae bacterium]|nr:hypothetical protein [Oscillospiraceae bacterium]MBR4193548.1 hypothetical protein [Oscillospiraceae bacterium]MBR4654989.1 hypothetical protein [Oscillospiraceae bacterium]